MERQQLDVIITVQFCPFWDDFQTAASLVKKNMKSFHQMMGLALFLVRGEKNEQPS